MLGILGSNLARDILGILGSNLAGDILGILGSNLARDILGILGSNLARDIFRIPVSALQMKKSRKSNRKIDKKKQNNSVPCLYLDSIVFNRKDNIKQL
jgi:hypothetical protein